MNSGAPASDALPDRASFGMIRSTSATTVAYSRAVKNCGVYALPRRGLRARLRAPSPRRGRFFRRST